MRAIVQDRYGGSEVLRLDDVDPPVAGDGEVVVRVRAAAVGAETWHLVTGLPRLVRLGTGLRRPRTRVPGMDLAGVVESVGARVTRFRPGDAVFGVAVGGALAELARARADRLAPKPERLSYEQAAALAVSGVTALKAVRDVGRVSAGQGVLVTGAGGGVGTYAVQLAVAAGAHVTGVCSAGKADLVRSLGAEDVVDHARAEITDGGRRYDVVLDIAGQRSLALLRSATTPGGTVVIVGGEGGPWLGGVDRVLRAVLLSPFVGQSLRAFVSSERAADLEALAALVEAGTVTPVLDRTYPLAEAAAAVERVGAGRARGKIVVVV